MIRVSWTANLDTPVLGWRWWKHLRQRWSRGFDDSVTWNLNTECARWLVPRLKRFRSLNIGFPSDMTMEQWNAHLDEMIWALEQVILDDLWPDGMTKKSWTARNKRIDRGLKLLGQYFQALWW